MPGIGTSSAGIALRMPPSTDSALSWSPVKLKLLSFFSLGPTVTDCVTPCGYFSCQATSVYVPGGTPFISKCPSLSVTEKNECGSTPTYARIHGCWLHLTGTTVSGRFNCLVMGAAPGPCP